MLADGQTDITKLIVAFRHLANVSNNKGLFPLTDKALFNRLKVTLCSQNLVTTRNTFNEHFSVLSHTELADRRISLVSPTQADVLPHCTVAGTTPTTWGRAPACAKKDTPQQPRTKAPPNRVLSGPNFLRSEGLNSSYSSFRLNPASRPSVTCSS